MTPTISAGREQGAIRYRCACVDRDSVQCAAIRYGMDHWGEACECGCHQWDDEDDADAWASVSPIHAGGQP